MRKVLFPLLLLGLVVSRSSAVEWQLTTYSGSDTHASWCGEEIAFESNRAPGIDIWCMDEAGEAAGIRPITATTMWLDRCPAWSPGCDLVYFESAYLTAPRDIYSVSSAGPPDEPVPLTTDPWDDMTPDASAEGIVFWSNRSGDDVYWMDSRGEAFGLSRLTTDPADDWYPTWSPDGSHVAFQSNRGGTLSIWVMNSGGETYGLERYTHGPEADSRPAWSPDGQYIAFGREGVGIFTVSVATHAEYQVTFGSTDAGPAWSPDGSQIAFERLGAVNYDIWCTDDVPSTGVHDGVSWGLIKAWYRQGGDRLPN